MIIHSFKSSNIYNSCFFLLLILIAGSSLGQSPGLGPHFPALST